LTKKAAGPRVSKTLPMEGKKRKYKIRKIPR